MRRSAAALALALLLPLPALAGEVTVKPGETLSEIAERYGTSVERLMQLNGLRSPQDLWAGSRIQVPGAGGSSGRGGAGTGAGNYTVKSGETLSEIAERYGTSVERLMQLNGLRTAQDLWAGSRIQVPGASPARPSGASRASAPVNRNAREHQVQPGETLSEIADRYGIPMGRLVSLNNLSKPNDLQAGTTLKLRQPSPTTKPAAKATASRPPARPRPTAVASKPAAKPTPKAAASPAAATTTAATITAAATTAAAPSKPTPSSSAKPTATASASASPVTPASTAAVTPAATPAKPATSPAAKPAASSPATSTASAKPSKPANPDWRSYGPLQVDWANWQPMAGSYVAPSLNSEGQPLYLAINCSARRLNATGQSGTWKTWDAPQSDFEEQLISDLCKTKGS
ncbi:MAG: LysM peptidoglycan-binding domain-containing protein [Vulcanococcus sp.]